MKVLLLGSMALPIAALAACGGESGSAPSGPPVTIPSPTPSISPTPAPTPTPPPSAAFIAQAGAPLVGEVFFDINESGVFGDTVQTVEDILAATNRNGAFGRDAVGRLTAAEPPASANVQARVNAISAQTGFRYGDLIAPAGAIVYAPVTCLLDSLDEDFVPQNLGIDMSAAELARFDAHAAFAGSDLTQQAIGRQIVATNLKLLAHPGYQANQGFPTGRFSVRTGLAHVRSQLATGAIDLSATDSILAILQRAPRAALTSDAGRRAAAQLIARYGEAIDRYLTAPDRIADIEYGLRLTVLPKLEWLFNTNGPSPALLAQVEAITVDDLIAAFTGFRDIPAIDIATAQFVAAPDFVFFTTVTEGHFTQAQFVYNDIAEPFFGVDSFNTKVIAVRVPDVFAGKLTATLENDGTVTVRTIGTVPDLIWIEYDSRYESSFASPPAATSRFYMDRTPPL